MIETKKNHFLIRLITPLNRTLIATSIVLIFFLISVSGFVFPELESWSAKVANREYNGEGFIETIEAVCWIFASLIYFLLLVKDVRRNGWRLVGFWLLFFALFCFVSFGEEISWGQHLFSFEPSEFVQEINKQKELNIHNLNISKIVGMETEDQNYEIFQNFTSILNPLFYLICGIFWFVIPLAKRIGFFQRNKINGIMQQSYT